MTNNNQTDSGDSLFSEIAKKIQEVNSKTNEESLEEKMEKRNREMYGNKQIEDVRNEIQEEQVNEIRSKRNEKFKNARLNKQQTIDLTQKLIERIQINPEFYKSCNEINVKVKKKKF